MLEAGDQIDIWVVDHPLGRGGMGSVYRCHNRNATRILAAVKVLESHLRAHKEIEARFIREAEILFQLDHPNIVKVRNVRTDHDPPYLEMEFVEGESLEDVLQNGPVPYDRALELMAQAAAAVHYLHRKGVRHRDIKPPNLLVRKDGRLKLVDFGLALESDTSRITQHGMAFGTVSYAPPEWASPELDPTAWDMYALGVVFWEILTGEVAFPMSGQGNARQQAMQVIIRKQGHPPLDPGEAFPRALRDLIADMTQADLAKRLVDSDEVRRRLHALEGLGPPPPTDTFDPDDEPSVVVSAPTPGVPPVRTVSEHTWVGDDAPPPRDKPRGSAAPSRGLIAASVVSLGAVGVGVVAVLLVLAVWWFLPSSGGQRPLEVVITGVSDDVPLEITVAGEVPTGRGLDRRLAAAPLGPQDVAWYVGEGCSASVCAGGDCPAWCGVGRSEIVIEAGEGAQLVKVQVDAPATRTVRLPLSGLRDHPVDATLGGVAGRKTADGLAFAGLLPGTHDLRITAGSCPEGALDCASAGQCPPGCADLRVERVVSWSGTSLERIDLGLDEGKATKSSKAATAPDPQPDPPEPAPSPDPAPAAPVPAPTPAPASSGPGGPPVTFDQFAAWLVDHPDYQPNGPRAARAGYLEGWSGATPPAGASGPVKGVSWFAANAYCRGRGGLLAPDAAPAAGTMFEWRDNGGKPAAIDSALGQSIPTSGTDAIMMQHGVVRCAR